MMSVLKFFFGSGWWIAWHAVLLISLVPLWAVMDWMRTMEPGKGPQGGEAIVLFLLLVVMVLIGVSLVNGLMWAGTQPWTWVQRYVLFPFCLIVGWGFALWLIFWLANESSLAETSPTARVAMWWGLVASFAVIYLGNLCAMAAVRDA